MSEPEKPASRRFLRVLSILLLIGACAAFVFLQQLSDEDTESASSSAQQAPLTKITGPENDPFLIHAYKLREETGRDNALIYYQEASFLAPEHSNQEEHIRTYLLTGTKNPELDLEALVESWQPALAKIREGLAVGHAENVPHDLGYATPVPNYLHASRSIRMLLVEGYQLEQQGQYDEAITNYLDALRMATEYGSENGLLIGSLISIAGQSMAHGRLVEIATAEELTDEQLVRIKEEVELIDESTPGIAVGFSGELEMNVNGARNGIERIKNATREEMKTIRKEYGRDGFIGWLITTKGSLIGDLKLHQKESEKVLGIVVEGSLHDPYSEEHMEAMKTANAMVFQMRSIYARNAVPNFVEATTRYYVMVANRRMLLVQIAIERHKLRHGEYPEMLEAIDADFAEGLPVDPFSGKAFVYRRKDDGSGYLLYSLGPNQTAPAAEANIKYDPTNGTLSDGEIIRER